jgi:exopolysaccharide biosynthesis polyprenyl glycosylphosphotransferase
VSVLSGLFGSGHSETSSVSAVASPRVVREGTPPGGDRARSAPHAQARRHERSSLRRHLVAGDILGLALAWTPVALFGAAGRLTPSFLTATVAVAITVAAMHEMGLYRSRVCAKRASEAVRVVAGATAGAAGFAFLQWMGAGLTVRGPLQGWLVGIPIVLFFRWRYVRWLKVRRAEGHFLRTVVLVGTNDDAVALWTMLVGEPELGYRVGAVLGNYSLGAPWSDLPTSPNLEDLAVLADQVEASGVIIVSGSLPAGETSSAVTEALAAGLHVQVWPGLAGVASRRLRMAPVSGVPVLYVEPRRMARWQVVAKRAVDLLLATVIAIAAAPLMVLVALAIKMSDGGPVLNRGERVGRSGVHITVLKFRTMVPNASELLGDVAILNERTGGPLFKAANDPRVTKIGRFLRATSIDELPQLWNVLNGTMSLVGPRPALPSEVAQFDPDLRRREQMRPGITGLWQVEARDNPSFSAYRRLDLAYVDNWTLGLDLSILLTTVHAVVSRGLRALLKVAVVRA